MLQLIEYLNIKQLEAFNLIIRLDSIISFLSNYNIKRRKKAMLCNVSRYLEKSILSQKWHRRKSSKITLHLTKIYAFYYVN